MAPRTTALPAAALAVVRQAPATRTVYRTAAPAQEERVVVERTSPQRTWAKTAMVIGGSSAAGAGVGGSGGKSRAIGRRCDGGGAASIYEASRRRLKVALFRAEPPGGGATHTLASFFVKSRRCVIAGQANSSRSRDHPDWFDRRQCNYGCSHYNDCEIRPRWRGLRHEPKPGDHHQRARGDDDAAASNLDGGGLDS